MKYLYLFFLFLPFTAFAQKIPDYGYYKIRIILPDSVIDSEVLPVTAEPHKNDSLFYYWYSANAVHITQGSYSGKLLNGVYNAYFNDRSLKSQGQFVKGLKDGIWRSWNSSGMMTALYTWKKGVKDGCYELFDAGGKITASGLYQHGVIIIPDKRPIWKRLNPFHRKKKHEGA